MSCNKLINLNIRPVKTEGITLQDRRRFEDEIKKAQCPSCGKNVYNKKALEKEINNY